MTSLDSETTIPEPDLEMERVARARQGVLTKPPGSLGRLEAIALQIAAFQARPAPSARPCSALIFAADHPVTRHRVSPYPSSVTRAMLANFGNGGAAAAVLSRTLRIPLHVFDVGVDVALGEGEPAADPRSGATLQRMVPRVEGGDVRTEDALSVEGFARCVAFGRDAVRARCPEDALVVVGEMGIGNTTVASVVAAKLLGAHDPAELVGAGTGATGALLESKRSVVRDAVARLRGVEAPLEVLRRGGGRELAAAYGAMRAALCQRSLVLVDGFIATAVAAVLIHEEPAARAGLIFSHRSAEHGHAVLLEHLGAAPLLNLGLCLGEASGALAAFSIVEIACALHGQMATFESAGIPGARP